MTNLSKYSEHFRDLTPEDIEKNFDQIARRIEAFRLRLDLEYILPHVKGPDVLDFPVGTGRFYPNLIRDYTVYGYDISAPYVERARRLHPEIAAHFDVASFEHIPHGRQFDTIVSLRVLNNIADLPQAAKNISAILKPGGRWIFNYPPTGRHAADMAALMAAGGMTLVDARRYDAHTAMGEFSRPLAALYTRLRGGIEGGFVPYLVFRIFDALFGRRGTILWIFEKAQ
jgi:2-polyprenyl-3-methyl-5-hydroxy-6-metoxy-1,4-benzoquinol methylase